MTMLGEDGDPAVPPGAMGVAVGGRDDPVSPPAVELECDALAPLAREAKRILLEAERVRWAGDAGVISLTDYRRRTTSLQQAADRLFRRVEALLRQPPGDGAGRDATHSQE